MDEFAENDGGSQNKNKFKPKSARQKIFDLLAKRSHSEKELRQKLKEKFSLEEINEAIEYIKSRNWLEDPHELAEKTAKILRKKGRGLFYINKYLKEKGLPPVSSDQELEKQKALDIVRARFSSKVIVLKNKMKIQKENRGTAKQVSELYKLQKLLMGKAMQMLVRRGYPEGMVRNVVREFFNEEIHTGETVDFEDESY